LLAVLFIQYQDSEAIINLSNLYWSFHVISKIVDVKNNTDRIHKVLYTLNEKNPLKKGRRHIAQLEKIKNNNALFLC